MRRRPSVTSLLGAVVPADLVRTDHRARGRESALCRGVRRPAARPRPARPVEWHDHIARRRRSAAAGFDSRFAGRPPRHAPRRPQEPADRCCRLRQGLLGRAAGDDGRARPRRGRRRRWTASRSSASCARPRRTPWPASASTPSGMSWVVTSPTASCRADLAPPATRRRRPGWRGSWATASTTSPTCWPTTGAPRWSCRGQPARRIALRRRSRRRSTSWCVPVSAPWGWTWARRSRGSRQRKTWPRRVTRNGRIFCVRFGETAPSRQPARRGGRSARRGARRRSSRATTGKP